MSKFLPPRGYYCVFLFTCERVIFLADLELYSMHKEKEMIRYENRRAGFVVYEIKIQFYVLQ